MKILPQKTLLTRVQVNKIDIKSSSDKAGIYLSKENRKHKRESLMSNSRYENLVLRDIMHNLFTHSCLKRVSNFAIETR